MRQETPADDNEVRILECRALVQCTAGTSNALQEGFNWASRCVPREQIICHPRFEREIKMVRL